MLLTDFKLSFDSTIFLCCAISVLSIDLYYFW